MRYCYKNTLNNFLNTSKSKWLEEMKNNFKKNVDLPLGLSQIHAWEDCYDVLVSTLDLFEKKYPGFTIIFEYTLPYESGRRPDVILLSAKQVVILEFKMKNKVEPADFDQCTAYVRDIREYHYESRDKEVIGVLVLTKIQNNINKDSETGTFICSGDKLGSLLMSTIAEQASVCNSDAWCNSSYEPLPTIVAAAKMFMNNEPLPNIRRVNSTGIPRAIECLSAIAKDAKENSKHVIAFVTGVPGAGKTFLGLQYVYDICKDNGLVNSVYLSGNGPLVEVLTDALKSKVFVKDLHTVVNEFLLHKAVDFKKNIIVFDEGQRAWDVKQMSEKGKSMTESEPDVIVRLCEERLDWCVLLILVGEGQEIYKGENSGIEQWNVALSKGNRDWKVICPDKLLSIFESEQEIVELDDSNALDLTVSLRTHLAGDVSNFANALIDGDTKKAKTFVKPIYKAGFSMFITRDLDKAKKYCVSRYDGNIEKRYGMIASSKGRDLPQFGVDNSFYGAINRGKYGKWFNTPRGSGVSCCDFRGVVTEFGIQGLELDMPIVCWDRDMAWNGAGWNKFKPGEDWDSDNNVYRINSYRVLLTRGRDGFIIFIPPTAALNSLYEMLKGLGLKELNDSTVVNTIDDLAKKDVVNLKSSENSLKNYFESKGFKVVDKRPNGGALWVEGDENKLAPHIDSVKKIFGATGGFASGRALKGHLGWWTKCDK